MTPLDAGPRCLTRREQEALRRSAARHDRDLTADIFALKENLEETWAARLRNLYYGGAPYFGTGNIHYWDCPEPLFAPAAAAVTLTTTDKLLIPSFWTTLWSNGLVGKRGKTLYWTYTGSITTVLTPGNIGIELYWGTADAGGTLLASSAALALVASQTTIPYRIEAYANNVGDPGTAMAVEAFAVCKFGTAVIASPNDHFLVPASAPATVNIDATAASGFNVQVKRSGSTVETIIARKVIAMAN